jgi:hypothetical protein
MKLSKVQSPASKVRRAARAALVSKDSGRWASDFGRRTRKNFGAWSLELGASPRDGVALVITLIMLSIITFLAVAFLVLTQRENKSATIAMDQKTAHHAADTAFQRVCSELLVDGMVHTNFQFFGMKVSTNFINYGGFIDGLSPSDPRNVNYDHETNNIGFMGGAVEWERNISDLLYNPRVPVFPVTNAGTGAREFRFYLDLNRNGRFDTNGLWPVIAFDNMGNPSYVTPNNSLVNISSGPPYPPLMSNNFTGDPEWIGVLEHPQEVHSADNRFISRYAYLVVPSSDTLDINSIHNHAKHTAPFTEGYYRNQGVGTYEVNLAGLLADLNTNMWWPNTLFGGAYFYNTGPGGFSSGLAFSNANDLLSYRYGGSFASLNAAAQLFPSSAVALNSADVDLYASGPLMLGSSSLTNPFFIFSANFPWSGADNTNHIWSIQDFFSSAKLPLSTFPNALQTLGTSNDSYNEYTYYRLLSALGSDSAPEQYKVNVNWANIRNGKVVPGMETNLLPWTPIEFFTNAADRMFRQLGLLDMNSNLITVTNIPIYENPVPFGQVSSVNYYTPSVQRILQLAANIYDATTNRILPGSPVNYPSVFRPAFRSSLNGVASIVGFVEVTNLATDNSLRLPFLEVTNFVKSPQSYNAGINIYGVPWVIGAKKGVPNFNEMSIANPLGIQRNLMFTNSQFGTGSGPPWQTNQMIQIGISNSFGVEAWNSYTNAYPKPLKLIVTNLVSMEVSNEFGIDILNFQDVPFFNVMNLPGWPGWTGRASDNSFQVPLTSPLTNLFSAGIYLNHAPWLFPISPPQWGPIYVPHFFMGLSFKFQFILIDTSVNRVIDFVNLEDTEPMLDVDAILQGNFRNQRDQTSEYDIWETNLVNGGTSPPLGILNQIDAGEGVPAGYQNWIDPNRGSQGQRFNAEINNHITNGFPDPYPAQATIWRLVSWQANDPLVHYTARDLTSTNGQGGLYNTNALVFSGEPLPQGANLPNVGRMNYAYQPWGGNPQNPNPTFDNNYLVKDPFITKSDDWDFPTNKLWNVGILGRVHRGTAWQTIYLKPFNPTKVNWVQWNNDNTGYTNFYSGNNRFANIDGVLTQPNQDYSLFDVFTSTPNENATRGQLNVNQTNIADWSAILSGVNVLSNTPGSGLASVTIQPAGAFSWASPTPVAAIWKGITNTLANTNPLVGPVFPNHTFQHLGDILNTPELTVKSPFLNTNSPTANATNDEVLERIPQQIMSLLTLNQNPRFVIYSFGQTLHPANNSLVVGGPFNNLCTNYQITAETATRAVVRVDGSPDPKYTINNPDPQGRYYPPHIVVEQFNVLGPD